MVHNCRNHDVQELEIGGACRLLSVIEVRLLYFLVAVYNVRESHILTKVTCNVRVRLLECYLFVAGAEFVQNEMQLCNLRIPLIKLAHCVNNIRSDILVSAALKVQDCQNQFALPSDDVRKIVVRHHLYICLDYHLAKAR